MVLVLGSAGVLEHDLATLCLFYFAISVYLGGGLV